LSFGFQGDFGLMHGTSSEVVSNGIDVTKLINAEYDKSLLGIGFNLTGRFSGSSGWGGMGKVYTSFPLTYTHDIEASATYSTLQSSSKKTYSNFDPAFLIGFGGGVLKRFTFTEKLGLAIDLGLEIQIDIIGIDLYHLAIIGCGVFSDVNLEYHINRHFYFDFGINFKVLGGLGVYGYQEADMQVTTDEYMFFISPGISIGYQF
jgi:hypothetical protein